MTGSIEWERRAEPAAETPGLEAAALPPRDLMRADFVQADLMRTDLTRLPGIVIGFTLDGRILFLSRDARRMLVAGEAGAPAPDDRSFFDFVHPEDVATARRSIAVAGQRADGGVAMTLRLAACAGGYRVIEGPLAHQPASDGGSGWLMFVGHDVSRYHQINEQYLAVLEGSYQGIAVHRGGQPLFCNTAMAHMVGVATREALMTEPSIAPFLHPDDRPLIMTNIGARLVGQAAPGNYEFRLISRSGREVWVDCRATRVEWDGEPAILASCFNINDRKRAEEAQRHSEELFARVFQTSPDFISLTWLADGTFINVNESFVKTFGYRREDLIGRTIHEFKLWPDAATRACFFAELAARGTVRNFEARGETRDGAVRDFQVSGEVMTYEDQELLLIVGRDFSDRKRQEAELIASKEAADLANRAKSEFLANMSHELRTPLNAILGFSEIIKNQIHGVLNEPKYAEYAADIHASGSHLLSIINDILDLSKVEAGKLEVLDGEIHFGEIMDNCLRLIAPRARAAEVEIHTDLPLGLPAFIADERLTKQILLNLLSNAIKFTPKGGVVVVAATATEGGGTSAGEVAFRVSDTGIGMNEDGIRRALTPFGQVDSSLRRNHQGSGLGLPLVIAFVERQGGRFAIESAIGRGTTITISFPVAE